MVDDEDFESLSNYRWYAAKSKYVYYARRGIWTGSKMVLLSMHRTIMKAQPGQVVDHKDGNTLNNQKSNLRFCTYVQNNANRISKRGSGSIYKGVHWHKGSEAWRANIGVNKKQLALGSFQTEEDAARAYNTAAASIYGEFAKLNIIP